MYWNVRLTLFGGHVDKSFTSYDEARSKVAQMIRAFRKHSPVTTAERGSLWLIHGPNGDDPFEIALTAIISL